MSSKLFGDTAHVNEINSIIEELRKSKLINWKTSIYKDIIVI